MRIALSALLILSALTFAFPIAAQDSAAQDSAAQDSARQARELFDAGRQSLDAGRYQVAAEQLEASFSLAPRLSTAFNWALALRGLGRAIRAESLYERLIEGELGRLSRQDRARVESLRDEVRATIGMLDVFVDGGEEVSVRLDGELVPVAGSRHFHTRLNPGDHVVVVQARDQATEERLVEGTGEALRLNIELHHAEDSRPGTLMLRSDDESAFFRVGDGVAEGESPLRLELPAGTYEVTVEGRYGEGRTTVELPAGRRVSLTLDPPERGLLRRPWFWIVAGVVVVGAAAAAIAVSQIEREAPPVESQIFDTIFAIRRAP